MGDVLCLSEAEKGGVNSRPIKIDGLLKVDLYKDTTQQMI